MRLWRLTRAPFAALDGAGPRQWGGRYSSPGRPVVNFASEAGLAVLIALRYLADDWSDMADDFVLGWTEVDAAPARIPSCANDSDTRQWVDDWLEHGASLLVAVPSRVLPEANVILFNPAHPDAGAVAPLATRPFDFADCLHRPPMLEKYRNAL